jgi:GntR family transcriptional regulator/MocR family aminotransferase
MDVHVSLVGRSNLTAEIYRQLRQAILDGRLRPGDALPPTRELARSLNVARSTVTAAYDGLAGEGFVTGRVGAGTYVADLGAPPKPRHEARHDVLRARPLWDDVRVPTAFLRTPHFDFRTGIPDGSLFPHQTWRRLVARELRNSSFAPGMYGHPAGHPGLREAIARHIAVSRGMEVSPDDVTITNGTQQAIDLVSRVLLDPGDTVAVEDPGYRAPRGLFLSLDIRVVGVPLDRDGLIIDALPHRARLVYVTPSHQCPLGVALSLPRRRALLAWAEHNDAAILEDDYDSEFRFGDRPVEPLQTLDTGGRVIYVGSFSKTMLPSMRLGFLITPPSLTEATHKAKFVTDWHSSLLMQAAMARFIDDGGFARHLRRMSAEYRARHEIVSETIRRDFAGHLELIPSTSGLHIAALAPSLTPAAVSRIVEQASHLGVGVQKLSAYAITEAPMAGLVIGYGNIPTRDIREGLRKLRECFDA